MRAATHLAPACPTAIASPVLDAGRGQLHASAFARVPGTRPTDRVPSPPNQRAAVVRRASRRIEVVGRPRPIGEHQLRRPMRERSRARH
ncbi:hypothetical protein WJ07_28080 [Burkholderia vietnamiensis]|nr:hypothetical protein WJ07_28080 [Burkholderia vietnamiensis]